jgi:Ca2+-transporting ATPase
MARSIETQKFIQTEQIAWHSFPLGDVFAHLSSKRDGLSSEEAKMRLKHFGGNDFLPHSNARFLKIFLNVFFNPFFGVAVFSAILALLAKMYIESATVFLFSVFGFAMCFFQKIGIEKNIKKTKSLESKISLVLRDGIQKYVSATEIVPGDVIIFHSGDEILADARIIQSLGLKMDESKLTYSDSVVSKGVSAVSAGTDVPGRVNTIYGGTFVSDGSGEAVVFGTGQNLEIFRSGNTQEKDYFSETLLERKISRLGNFLSAVVLASSSGILLFGFIKGKSLQESFVAASAISASAVLSILYIAGFSSIMGGIAKILSKKCAVKSLSVAEEIGGASVIIAGKSGLFTFGESKISKVLTPERRSGILELNSTVEYASNHLLALTYGVLVSESSAENISDNPEECAVKGNKIDNAFIKAAVSAGIDIKRLDYKFKKIGNMPHGGSRKFSVSFRETPEGERWAFIVGYADALIQSVKKIQVLNRYENAISFEIGVIKESIDEMAKIGLTVLAVCSKKIENRENLSNWMSDFRTVSDLNLVGLIGIKDPIIENSQILLSEARMAGIRTVLVAGDHTLSAKSFGVEVGIVQKNKVPEILEGKEIEAFDAKELSHRIRNVDIFSRASSEQKLKVATAWIEQGESVSIFGDSSDDAKVIKESNIGVSTKNAADSAKNAAGIIILDGGFESLLEAIKEGRTILNNIKKVFVYVLGLGLSEALLIGAGILFGFNTPVFAAQILWANIVVGIFPASILSKKEPENEIMNLPPSSEKKRFMGGRAIFITAVAGIVNAISLFGIFIFFKSSFNSLSYAQSVTFMALCINSLFLAFSASNLSKPIWESSFTENRGMIIFLGLGVLVSSLAAYIGPLNTILNSSSIGVLEWVIIFGGGVLGFLAVELAKWGMNKKLDIVR